MHTQCPHCRTLNHVTAGQLNSADGKVHCSHCEEVFNAFADLSEQDLDHVGQFSVSYLDMAAMEVGITDIKRVGVSLQSEAKQILEESKPQDREISYGFDDNALKQLSYDLADLRDSSFEIHDFTIEPDFFPEETGEVSIEPSFNLQELQELIEETEPPGETTMDESMATPDLLNLALVESAQEAEVASEEEKQAKPDIEIEPEETLEIKLEIETDSEAELEAESEFKMSQKEPPEDLPELPFDFPEDLPDIQPSKETLLPFDDLLTKKRSGRRLLFWSLIIITLVIIALGQLTWLGRSHLMQYQEGRQLFQFICKYAGCRLPTRKASEKIEILSRIVEVHPEKAGALRIHLTIINRAPFPQPYPKIQIELYDIKEVLVVNRLFQPDEYLGKTYPGVSLESGEILAVEMELDDPGNEVSGFRFEFY